MKKICIFLISLFFFVSITAEAQVYDSNVMVLDSETYQDKIMDKKAMMQEKQMEEMMDHSLMIGEEAMEDDEAQEAEEAEGTEEAEVAASKAEAIISGTEEGSIVAGTVKLMENENGVLVVANLSGVKPAGDHGFHVHQNGSCADGGNAAGGHFNPLSVDHGYLPQNGLEHAHAGDMGNITIDEDGNGALAVELTGVDLASIMGRAIILHAAPDDFSQPTGNAGGRIGCGIITEVEDVE